MSTITLTEEQLRKIPVEPTRRLGNAIGMIELFSCDCVLAIVDGDESLAYINARVCGRLGILALELAEVDDLTNIGLDSRLRFYNP